ncbi:MAG: HXXEE domain-containing protein, partial [Azorhizobium sp. 35-67-5]
MWLATACYGVHVLEEYQLNWRDWAHAVIKLPVEWNDFYIVNALVIVLGVSAAQLAAHA